jgi:PPK2 family polyphosphate:nucleotide phosphotransferase
VNSRKDFAVEPGSRLRLDRIDPASHGRYADEAAAGAEIERDRTRLTRMQGRLYAEGAQSLLIVLQALDAGGKDGTIRHVFGAFNPLGAEVHAFKVPTAEEAAHDFLWRAHRVTPAHGRIAIFNRSYYEDVLVTRVHGTATDDLAERRCRRIRDFEKNLTQAGTTILKFFLHISPDEQLRRFEQRLDDPAKRWKISASDYADRKHWDEFMAAYEDALARTSTERAPWYVIPANHKWFRNLAVASIVADTLDAMDPQVPSPAVDLDAIRAEYHAAVRAQGEG